MLPAPPGDPGDTTGTTVEADKAALRERMRRVRAEITPHERAARSRRISRSVLELLEGRRLHAVMAFWSFGSEVSTGPLVDDLARVGHRILLPVVRDGDLVAADYRPGDRVEETTYGPREPVSYAPADPEDVDAVVLPGLAFDRLGGRLGYGGGYYDRFLRRLSPRSLLVAVAFAEQVLPNVPTGAGDVPVHFVVTDDEVIRCSDSPQDLRGSG